MLGVLECVCSAEVSRLVLVNSLDVYEEVVLSVEDAVTARPGTWVLWMLRGIGVDGVEVGFEIRVVLEPLATLLAFRRMALGYVGREFFVCCERHRLNVGFVHVVQSSLLLGSLL